MPEGTAMKATRSDHWKHIHFVIISSNLWWTLLGGLSKARHRPLLFAKPATHSCSGTSQCHRSTSVWVFAMSSLHFRRGLHEGPIKKAPTKIQTWKFPSLKYMVICRGFVESLPLPYGTYSNLQVSMGAPVSWHPKNYKLEHCLYQRYNLVYGDCGTQLGPFGTS